MVKNDALNKSTIKVIVKVLNLLTDGKADALVRRILGLVFDGRGRPPCHGLSFLD